MYETVVHQLIEAAQLVTCTAMLGQLSRTRVIDPPRPLRFLADVLRPRERCPRARVPLTVVVRLAVGELRLDTARDWQRASRLSLTSAWDDLLHGEGAYVRGQWMSYGGIDGRIGREQRQATHDHGLR
jgi:hypothetical protein